ncbi:MAG: metalloregulator ArsR/SmtB family transcription factor [Elusimicrobiota bacterium]
MELIKILKLISNTTRLRILNLLKEREVCNCELKEVLKISQPAVSKHIKKLKNFGLINKREDGWWSYYSINFKNPEIRKIILSFLDIISSDNKIKADLKKLYNIKCLSVEKKNEGYKNKSKKDILKYR